MLPIKIRLAAVRVNAEKTQEQLAQEMGVTRVTIMNWESGKQKISEANLRLFAELCNFPKENIFLPK